MKETREVVVIQRHTSDQYKQSLLEEYFRLRHEIYCIERRWEPEQIDQRELDRYDRGLSEYIIGTVNHQVRAGCRVIYGNGFPLPLEAYHPVPFIRATEISRMVSRECEVNSICNLYTVLFHRLRSPIVQGHVYATMNERYLKCLQKKGFDIQALPGTPKLRGDERFLPVWINVYTLPWDKTYEKNPLSWW